MNVIAAIKGLMLDSLDCNCIESIWDEEFMCSPEILDEYLQQIDISHYIAVIDDIITAVDNWQAEYEDVEHSTWRELNNQTIDHKALLSVLWYFITKGQDNGADGNARYLSLRSSTLYLKLLSVPGSRVYHAFHPYLCIKAMSVFKYGILIAPKQKKRSKKQADSFDSNDVHLTAQETVTLVRELNVTMTSLKLFITKFSLQSDENLVEEIIERLAETTRLEVNTSDFMTYSRPNLNRANSIISLSLFCRNAYECLRSLCVPQHGDVEDTVIIVMKYLLPGVLFADRDLSLREQCTIRDHTIHFLKYLVLTIGVDSLRGATLFIHNIFTKIGDRAEARQKGKESIVEIMKILPNNQYSEIVRWLLDCAHCEKASYRLLALEIVAQLLYENRDISLSDNIPVEQVDTTSSNIDTISNTGPNSTETDDDRQEEPVEASTSAPSNESDIMLHKYMLAIIFARCRDSSGIVRTKALGLLVQCMRSDNMVVQSLMNEIFVLNHQNESNERGFLNYKQLTAALRKNTIMDPLPGARVILSELENMSNDNKVHVRKAALQVLESIVKLNRSWLTANILKIMGSCCRDPAVSIRKEIVLIISELLQRYPDDRELAKLWAKCVVPLVLDQEGKLQECVLRAMRLMIIDKLKQYNQQQDDVWSALPWQLLTHIVQYNLHLCLMKAFEIWIKGKEIRSCLINDVCSHVGTENNSTAWIVLFCLSLHMDFKNPLFAVDYYRQAVSSNQVSVSLLVVVLEVLLSCSAYLPRQVQEEMLQELKTDLCNFNVERELIKLNVEIAMDLTYHVAESKKEAGKRAKSWTGEILELCQTYLEDTFQLEATKALDGEQFVRHLHTLGEIAMYNPKQIRVKTFHLLQRYLFLPERNSGGRLSCIPFAKPLTVVAIGKLCLLNQLWAQETTKPLIKLLNSTQDLPTLINIMFVLRDMCVRYGAIMEPYLPSLWMCLKDAATDVRLTALTCLVELLQNNYIKFRGAMLFHILSMLCDTDENIVELATYFLQDYLIPTSKNIMLEHIVNAIFHYNGYRGHEFYGKHSLSREEREKFLMIGEPYRRHRQKLYEFMLDNMNEEQRRQTKINLVTKVLDGAAEGKIRLDADGESVILDAIKILNSKNIQHRGLQQEPEDEQAEENVERMATLVAKVTNKAIIEVEKTFMIEHIVPVAIHLKAVLQERYSSLVPHLMEYLRDMMKDYKNEVMEIFAEDKQTAEEILFDISELERGERQPENVSVAEEQNTARADDAIPQPIASLLQNSSPWIRQSIGPEIVRCYKIGGEEMMLRYARAKLRRLKEKNRRISSCIRPNSHSLIDGIEDFLVEPKEEEMSEKGGEDDCGRELECSESEGIDTGVFVQHLQTELGTEENCETSTTMVTGEDTCEIYLQGHPETMVTTEENCEAAQEHLESMGTSEQNCEIHRAAQEEETMDICEDCRPAYQNSDSTVQQEAGSARDNLREINSVVEGHENLMEQHEVMHCEEQSSIVHESGREFEDTRVNIVDGRNANDSPTKKIKKRSSDSLNESSHTKKIKQVTSTPVVSSATQADFSVDVSAINVSPCVKPNIR